MDAADSSCGIICRRTEPLDVSQKCSLLRASAGQVGNNRGHLYPGSGDRLRLTALIRREAFKLLAAVRRVKRQQQAYRQQNYKGADHIPVERPSFMPLADDEQGEAEEREHEDDYAEIKADEEKQ